ncbi:hypothetical protein BS50DRAFT_55815 [Corynespora cassiicola Philippines]|uniref:Uncharacterized protein n=1 Tax=Corynespora cassiicola Philippines TaxID=1448308 RepID=A0A2T2NJA7_CORCC|nr:hypothetical protein BS50DRAFT_55815 [Corynespora cassiicola Philippines]
MVPPAPPGRLPLPRPCPRPQPLHRASIERPPRWRAKTCRPPNPEHLRCSLVRQRACCRNFPRLKPALRAWSLALAEPPPLATGANRRGPQTPFSITAVAAHSSSASDSPARCLLPGCSGRKTICPKSRHQAGAPSLARRRIFGPTVSCPAGLQFGRQCSCANPKAHRTFSRFVFPFLYGSLDSPSPLVLWSSVSAKAATCRPLALYDRLQPASVGQCLPTGFHILQYLPFVIQRRSSLDAMCGLKFSKRTALRGGATARAYNLELICELMEHIESCRFCSGASTSSHMYETVQKVWLTHSKHLADPPW